MICSGQSTNFRGNRMILKPRKGFSFIVKFIDFFNPVIVLLSIAGLILEYTEYKEYVLYPNRIIDMVFVVDFLLRLISFPSGKYFFKSYGWVDFLASIPGFTAFMQFGQYFGLFKVMRIGRFFKIIRVLRFLRIFSFLKKMKGDSAFIQDRIMKIGVTIVIVFVTGLGFTDYYITEYFTDLKKDNVVTAMDFSRQKVSKLPGRIENVIYYTDNAVLYNPEGIIVKSYTDYSEKLQSMSRWYVEISFSDKSVYIDGHILPVKGVMIAADDIMKKHDNIMLILISSLILILVILIFYIGYIFAKDMKIVQLINDSVDAGDYWLLKEEGRKYSPSGNLAIEEGEDEMISLIKMAARLAESAESSTGLTGMDSSMFTGSDITSALEDSVQLSGAGIDQFTAAPGLDEIKKAEEIPELLSGEAEELSGAGFSVDLPDSGKVPVLGESDALYVERMEHSIEIPEVQEADEDGLDIDPLHLKLESIEKTVKEINSKLSSVKENMDRGLESVARDAASRAVKITSKSIGEYIQRKLSGQ